MAVGLGFCCEVDFVNFTDRSINVGCDDLVDAPCSKSAVNRHLMARLQLVRANRARADRSVLEVQLRNY
jgi:hypothetical protein